MYVNRIARCVVLAQKFVVNYNSKEGWIIQCYEILSKSNLLVSLHMLPPISQCTMYHIICALRIFVAFTSFCEHPCTSRIFTHFKDLHNFVAIVFNDLLQCIWNGFSQWWQHGCQIQFYTWKWRTSQRVLTKTSIAVISISCIPIPNSNYLTSIWRDYICCSCDKKSQSTKKIVKLELQGISELHHQPHKSSSCKQSKGVVMFCCVSWCSDIVVAWCTYHSIPCCNKCNLHKIIPWLSPRSFQRYLRKMNVT
jgi:hypothetical protein